MNIWSVKIVPNFNSLSGVGNGFGDTNGKVIAHNITHINLLDGGIGFGFFVFSILMSNILIPPYIWQVSLL